MTNLINQLAEIDVQRNLPAEIDINNIARTFTSNFRKLDDFKNFRSDYEKKNALARWWHNDKLKNAQLDSIEVQAEFSKTVGQLIAISIMQSKELTNQQSSLNQQQLKLQGQANGIAIQAESLQQQQTRLAEQSDKLEKLVREYFELKGLTQDGAKKLIEMAREIKQTKEELIRDFSKNTEQIASSFADAKDSFRAELQAIETFKSESVSSLARLSEETTLRLDQLNTSADHHQASLTALSEQQSAMIQRSARLESALAATGARTEELHQQQEALRQTQQGQIEEFSAYKKASEEAFEQQFLEVHGHLGRHVQAFEAFKSESVSALSRLSEETGQRLDRLNTSADHHQASLTALSEQQSAMIQRSAQLDSGLAATTTHTKELHQQQEALRQAQQGQIEEFSAYKKASEVKVDLLASALAQATDRLDDQQRQLLESLQRLSGDLATSREAISGLGQTIDVRLQGVRRVTLALSIGLVLTWGILAYQFIV